MVRTRYTYGEEHQTIAVEDNECDSIGSETKASHCDAELQYSQAEHGLWQSQDVISGSNHDDDCEFAISNFLERGLHLYDGFGLRREGGRVRDDSVLIEQRGRVPSKNA
jgi:hypothetical protein